MGWVMRSEHELDRIEVLAQVNDGRLSVRNGANMPDVSKRQMFRLLKRYRTEGAPAIRHKARCKAPNSLFYAANRDYALALIKEKYEDSGLTLVAKMLAENHGFQILPRHAAQMNG